MSAIFTEKELSKYSVTRAINQLIESQKSQPPGCNGRLKDFEGEVHQSLVDAYKAAPNSPEPAGALIPIAALKGLSATNGATSGGFLVNESFAASIVPALRAVSRCVDLGATVFEGLRDTAVLPFEQTTSDAQWLAELEAAADPSDSTYAQSKLVPRRVVSVGRYSQQLLKQSSLGIENFMRSDLLKVNGTALDKACLVGNGNKEPLGLINRVDSTLNTVTFGGAAATWAKLISFQSACALDNAYGASGYITSLAAAEKWMNLKADSTGIRFLWNGDISSGEVAGARAFSTNNMPAGTDKVVYSGDWSQLAIGIWSDALEIVIDTFTLKKTGMVEIVSTLLADVGVINAAAFAVSTDSGAV